MICEFMTWYHLGDQEMDGEAVSFHELVPSQDPCSGKPAPLPSPRYDWNKGYRLAQYRKGPVLVHDPSGTKTYLEPSSAQWQLYQDPKNGKFVVWAGEGYAPKYCKRLMKAEQEAQRQENEGNFQGAHGIRSKHLACRRHLAHDSLDIL